MENMFGVLSIPYSEMDLAQHCWDRLTHNCT